MSEFCGSFKTGSRSEDDLMLEVLGAGSLMRSVNYRHLP